MSDAGADDDSAVATLKKAVIGLLGGPTKQARFITELAASLGRRKIDVSGIETALAELTVEDQVMVRDHFCADPHLAGIDLRIAALVESGQGSEGHRNAIREIDEAWDKWLGSYLANHRCG
jgi:hypothetical protein